MIPSPPVGVISPRLRLSCRIARMQRLKTIIPVCFALSLAACGGGGHLSVELPPGGRTLDLEFRPGSASQHPLPFRISGGVPPYEPSIDGCPDWVTLFTDQAILAGTAPTQDRGKIFYCTYRVTETDPGFRPARSVSYGLRLMVGPGHELTLPDNVPGTVNLRVGTFGSEEFPGVASGGVPPYAYAFTCAGGSLPSGMGFAPGTRIFAGTPDAPFRDSCTYTVTDSSQPMATVSRAVEVEVSGVALTFDDDVPGTVNLRVGTFGSEEFPGVASGGVPPYAYAFTCAGGSLPSGMGFAPGTRIFAGTPDAPFRDSCTYTVTDSSQPMATVSRAVEVEVSGVALTLDDDVPGTVNLRVGTFGSEEFPGVASGGVPPYAYAFTCAGGSLPSGMGFAPGTRIFAGTPDAPFRDSCTYTVTDSSQPMATVSRAVEVEVSGVALTFDDDVPGTVNLRVGTFGSEEFPGVASGGVPPYAYAFTCAGGSLPSGMGFAPATRIFAGTPDAPFRDSCTYTVTDSSQPMATVSRRIEVVVESLALPDTPDQIRFVIGDFRSFTLPAVTGGVGPYTYTLTCAGGGLPPGLGFAPATRELAGVTDAVFDDSCTYTVTDSAQPVATASRDIVVTSTAAGALDLPVVPDQRFVIDTFRSVTLPAARGGVGPYTYTFTCDGGALPSGVGFAPATRVLAGVANAAFDRSCTYTVTDSSQPAVMVERDIEVTVESLHLPDTPENLLFVVGTSRSVTLPAATGGVGEYTYTFACEGGSLPSGVDFAPATRVLAGVAGAAFDRSCTYTVTDSSTPPATVSRTIEVTVESLHLPDTPENVRFVIGDFRSFTLPAATGGVAPYTYTFACDDESLPSGVGFAPATRVLAGVAGAAFDDSCTYTVTDSSTPPATVSRTIEVTVESLALPETRDQLRFVIGDSRSFTLSAATGGEPPYTYTFTCAGGRLPPGVRFSPASPVPAGTTPVLAGTGDAVFRDSCRYTVADSSQPVATVSKNIEVVVDPFARGRWRFRTRSLDPSEHPIDREDNEQQVLVILPRALPETGFAGDCWTYRLSGTLVPDPFGFGPDSRRLTYTYPGVDPLFDAPTTLRYEVRTYPEPVGGCPATPVPQDDPQLETQDALCVDVAYLDTYPGTDTNTRQLQAVQVSIRDQASFDGTEYRCPDAPAESPSTSNAPVSNPVHTALAPVHARRAAGVAHAAVRDRVRDWSPDSPDSPGGGPRGIAITPSVEFASLSGLSDGFDYSGTSESASFGAETGAGVWQAGLVASFTHTELDYQAEAALAERGYRTGDHDTEILSLHPFAAWHAPSGGHFWASIGAGTGNLSHRDDLGFRSWSRSDVRLFAYAVGASVPVADMLSGALQAEAGIESFALDIEGGGRISSSLPTLKGRDWRAGLTWSAPVSGAPSVSMAYRHLTGDGPEGGRLEAQGSVAIPGIFDPRLSLTGSAEASFGLGDYEHDSWGLTGGVRFAPYRSRRGFGLELDTRFASLEDGGSAGVGMRVEAGYGLWGGPFFGTLRPHVGLTRHPAGGFLRRSVGVDLRDTPNTRAKVEIHDHPHHRSPTLGFTLRQRF